MKSENEIPLQERYREILSAIEALSIRISEEFLRSLNYDQLNILIIRWAGFSRYLKNLRDSVAAGYEIGLHHIRGGCIDCNPEKIHPLKEFSLIVRDLCPEHKNNLLNYLKAWELKNGG